MSPAQLSALYVALAGVLVFAVMVATTVRAERKRRLLLGVVPFVASAVLASVVAFARSYLAKRFNLRVPTEASSEAASIAYLFLLVGPFDQFVAALGLRATTATSLVKRRVDIVRAAAASGFAAGMISGASMLSATAGSRWSMASVGAAGVAHASIASAWAFVLVRGSGVGDPRFRRAAAAATVVTTFIDMLLFSRGPAAIVAAVPLVLAALGVATTTYRDLARREGQARTRSRLLRVEPPSLDAIRKALRTRDRPISVGWVLLGTLTTLGAMTLAVAIGVAIGHRIGIDFSIVDRNPSSPDALAPLVLLGGLVLAAFPASGFFLARASLTKGVLEPALGSGVAIATIVLLLGLAAPVAIVFAVAFAPVAFGLACAGAWVGVER